MFRAFPTFILLFFPDEVVKASEILTLKTLTKNTDHTCYVCMSPCLRLAFTVTHFLQKLIHFYIFLFACSHSYSENQLYDEEEAAGLHKICVQNGNLRATFNNGNKNVCVMVEC